MQPSGKYYLVLSPQAAEKEGLKGVSRSELGSGCGCSRKSLSAPLTAARLAQTSRAPRVCLAISEVNLEPFQEAGLKVGRELFLRQQTHTPSRRKFGLSLHDD